jgi:hypothetical protein
MLPLLRFELRTSKVKIQHENWSQKTKLRAQNFKIGYPRVPTIGKLYVTEKLKKY